MRRAPSPLAASRNAPPSTRARLGAVGAPLPGRPEATPHQPLSGLESSQKRCALGQLSGAISAHRVAFLDVHAVQQRITNPTSEVSP